MDAHQQQQQQRRGRGMRERGRTQQDALAANQRVGCTPEQLVAAAAALVAGGFTAKVDATAVAAAAAAQDSGVEAYGSNKATGPNARGGSGGSAVALRRQLLTSRDMPCAGGGGAGADMMLVRYCRSRLLSYTSLL